MTARLSRGTPYILSSSDIENVLKSMTPKFEANIARILDMTDEEWRTLDKKVKVRHIIDFQNRATLAATMAAGAKAHTDLEAAATVITDTAEAQTLRDEVRALTELVKDLTKKQGAHK